MGIPKTISRCHSHLDCLKAPVHLSRGMGCRIGYKSCEPTHSIPDPDVTDIRHSPKLPFQDGTWDPLPSTPPTHASFLPSIHSPPYPAPPTLPAQTLFPRFTPIALPNNLHLVAFRKLRILCPSPTVSAVFFLAPGAWIILFIVLRSIVIVKVAEEAAVVTACDVAPDELRMMR